MRESRGINCNYVIPLITPHAQCERGKMISVGVHIYVYICFVVQKIF